MISLQTALPINNTALDLEAADSSVAIAKAVSLLRNDTRVLDWPAFSDAVAEREKKSGTSIGGGLLLPHGRGEFATGLAMSFIRLRVPIRVGADEVRFVMAVAVPASMAADYLRLVGALARVFRDPKSTAQLENIPTSRELVSWLDERCR